MATPPARTEISDTYPNPSDAVARVGFGRLYDYVVGLLGATGNAPEARTLLSAAKTGANSDITTISTLTGVGNGNTTQVQLGGTGGVGINTAPDTNAVLDVQSTTKGIRLPKMTSAQKVAITNTEALVVYDTTLQSAALNSGTGWTSLGETVLRAYNSGCTLSTAGSSATMTITAGTWVDSTSVKLMTLPSTYTKTTSAWAVGTGAGSWARTGAIIAGYVHWYLIRRPDTGVVDLCSTSSATGLVSADYVSGGGNVANAYTQFRRIASWQVSGGFWSLIYQDGDTFTRQTPVLDINSSSFADSSTLYTVSTPLGIKTEGIFTAFKIQPNAGMTNFWSPVIGTIGASTSITPLGKVYTDSGSPTSVNTFTVMTNTSSQIYGGSTAPTQTIKLVCEGWIDTRGRFE